MIDRLITTSTGLQFENPLILAPAPPKESKRKILKAFDAGWGGILTNTIGLHPVNNVAGPKTVYLRTSETKPYVSRVTRANTMSHSSWNWKLISDQPLKLWLPDFKENKKLYPKRMVIASIMVGADSGVEIENWRQLASACIDVGWAAIELNMSCPLTDRKDTGHCINCDAIIIISIVGGVKKSSGCADLGKTYAINLVVSKRLKSRI